MSNRHLIKFTCLPALCMATASLCAPAEAPLARLDALVKAVETYRVEQGAAPLQDAANYLAASDAAGRRKLETALHAVLLDESSALEAKQAACRILRDIATGASVPVLTALLKDPSTTHMALYALHSVPGDTVVGALTAVLAGAEDPQKVAILNALGRRGDPTALDAMAGRFGESDPDVARAAYEAVARVGGPLAAERLFRSQPAPALSEVWIDTCLVCADSLDPVAHQAPAETIYTAFSTPDRAAHVRYAAVRGLLRCGSSRGRACVQEAFSGGSEAWRKLVAELLRRNRDGDALDAITAVLSDLAPPARADAITLLADCGHAAALPAILVQMKSGNTAVADAAVMATGALGTLAHAGILMQAALEHGQPAGSPAFAALAALRDAGVDPWLMDRLDTAEGKACELCVELLRERRSPEAVPRLLALAGNRDDAPAAAIARALSDTDDLRAVPVLVDMVVHGKGHPDADKSLRAVCGRSDPRRCADALTAGYRRAQGEARIRLLGHMGALGFPDTVPTVVAALKERDAVTRDAAVKALCNWPDATVMEPVRDLARQGETPAHRILALRGYIRMITELQASPEEKAALCSHAMDIATRPAEQRLVLSALGGIPSLSAFELAAPYLDHPDLSTEAEKALLQMAKQSDAVRAALSDELQQRLFPEK